MLLASVLWVGCHPEPEELVVNEQMLVGTWVYSNNPKEHWRFDADKCGETWDLSDDVQEGEGTRFNWSTAGSKLMIDLYGEMGQHVYYDYTVISQSEHDLSYQDIYGNTRSFTKK